MKCWICGRHFVDEDIKKIHFFPPGQDKWINIRKIDYKGKRIPLCNQCFRTIGLQILMGRHYKIDLDD